MKTLNGGGLGCVVKGKRDKVNACVWVKLWDTQKEGKESTTWRSQTIHLHSLPMGTGQMRRHVYSYRKSTRSLFIKP